jgi:hypothetical protein
MVKGFLVPTPSSSAFAISSLTANYNVAKENAVQKKILWEKPKHGGRKLNINASIFSYGWFGCYGGCPMGSKG